MSERLPRLTARQIIRILERNGFALVRSSGSHHIYKNSAGKRVTVPVHGNKTLHPKIIQSILRDMGISAEDLSADIEK